MDNQNTQIVRDLGAALVDVRRADVDSMPFVMAPQGYAVHDLEKTLQIPTRKRGKVTMNDASSFIDYFNIHADESKIYGQVTPPKFVGVLNDNTESDPGWGDHRVTYDCPLSNEWQAWKAFSGQPRDQIAFSEFIESNTLDITSQAEGEPSGADMLEVATNFKAQKKVNFASGQRMANGGVNFVYQEEVNGTAGEKGQIKVPEVFWIGIPVFEGGAPYRIECKLRYRLKDGNLSMWFEMVRYHKVLEAAFMDIWEEIATGTGVKIWRGTPA